MVKILGEHLIRDNIVGVMELIKNGYDADACKVTVELKNLSNPEETEITIEDDGTGMNEETIKGPWSEPAHGGKQSRKDRQIVSKKGRLPLGEKGVGRFAAQKLGRYLDLVTRPEEGHTEFHVAIDWDDFDKSDTYIDEVQFDLEKRDPVIFTGNSHGTLLRIRNVMIPWKKRDVEKLQASLIKLLSPTTEVRDFEVELICPDYPDLQNLDRGNILEKYQFKIDCGIDNQGKANYVYYHRFPDDKEHKNEVKDQFIWSGANEDWQEFSPSCGPIRVVILAWLRKNETLNAYGITKAQLNAMCGMGIYRDGFRILPYGDSGDDWLGLDPRRTNQPGEKYGNNQIIGMVEVSQKENRELVDKTDREGLQENTAYSNMRDLVLAVMSILETESLEERSNASKPPESTRTLKKTIQSLQERIDELENKPQKITEVPVDENNKDGKDEGGTHFTETKHETVVEVPISELEEIKDHVEKVESSAEEAVKELFSIGEEKREAFLHMMGIGLAAERFTHEFDRVVKEIDKYLEDLEQRYPYDSPVGSIRRRVEVLKNEVSLMSIARYVRRVEPRPHTDVKGVISLSIEAHSDELKSNNITLEGKPEDSFIAEISGASLSQVIDNIIANAVYWLGIKSEVNDRRLFINVNSKAKEIVISDNGTLIPPNIKKALFKAPFVTSKPNGRGLGLYISSEILKKNNAVIGFLEESDGRNIYHSAAFRVAFPI